MSIILTSFNHEKYLAEAIDSALGQTFSDFELIIWDDHSDDRSWPIITGYSDERIKAFRNEERTRGIYGINRAISEVATGEYIAIHHSDDVWRLDKLEKQVAYLDEHHDVGAVFTNAQAIGESGGPLLDTQHWYSTIFDQPNRSRFEWLRHFFLSGNALCHPSVLIRKECYSNCGLYRYGFQQIADLDMWMRLCLQYEIHVLPEKLVNFRVRDGDANTSADTEGMRVRGHFEMIHTLDHYLAIETPDELLKVFPESRRYIHKSDEDVTFALAMAMLDVSGFPASKMFALNIIRSKLIDDSQRHYLAIAHQFSFGEFAELVAQQDPMQILRLEGLSGALSDQDLKLAELSGAVAEKDLQLAELSSVVSENARRLSEKEMALQALLQSKSWRLTAPIRLLFDLCVKLRRFFAIGPK